MRGPQDRARVEVVALVASAAGLDALSVVLRGLPVDLPVAVVVQQHLGGQASVLPKILERRLGRPVVWAVDGAPVVVPGRVTVTPPRTCMEVLPDGTCGLHPLESASERPHDGLLVSLADSFRDRAMGVVLSGGGTDGAAGVGTLTAAGGVVIAQAADTAEYPSMPRAAAAAGADLVLPLHEIAGVVAEVVRGGPLPKPPDEVDAIRLTFGEVGEAARLARAIDWSQHVLGPVHRWPAALRTAVRLAATHPDPAVVYVGEQLMVLFNDAVMPSWGAKAAEVFGRPLFEVFPEVEYQREWFVRARSGEPVSLALHHVLYFRRRTALTRGWFQMTFTPIHDEHGVVLGIFEVVTDRTEQVLASRRLATLSELAGTAAEGGRREALDTALARLAGSEDVTFALAYLTAPGGAAVNLVGATGVEAGGPLAPRHVVLRAGTAGWPLSTAVTDRVPVVVDDAGDRFRGHLVGREPREPGVAVIVPLHDPAENRVAGALVLGADPLLPFDDTYREFFRTAGETIAGKMAESHARHHEHERLAKLAELDRAKTEFFSNVSHEFRTPLTLMLGPLEETLRRADELPDGVAAELEVAQRNTRRLLRLVGTLLDFSQAEAGRLHAHLASTDLAASTTEIVSMFRGAAEAAGLKLTVDVPPLPEPVRVDPEMWEKIVSNLLSNALKFTWQGGIEVSLRALPMHTELRVRDTGVGIPKEEQPYIFQRFHRAREARGRTHEGAGIGLALVEELVHRHHGRVRVTSEQGTGTTFTVWIPSGRRPSEPAAAQPSPPGGVAALMAEEALRWDAAREKNHAALGMDVEPVLDQRLACRAVGARVLVVDDNADMRDYLSRLLGGNWSVTVAGDGEEALQLIARERPDLILADVMMPGMDGFALLHAIRADEDLTSTPVVLVTARAGEETAIEGLLAGADDYIVKPFSARELVARVGAELELARQRRQNERRLRALINASWDVAYRMSPDWTEMRTLAGHGFIADTDRPSTSWLDTYIHPDDQSHVNATIQQAIRTKSVFELEHRVRRPDGTLGWTLSRAVPLLDDDGQIVEWVGAATDVTTRHPSAES
ncbi:response regulator [Pseudonocardia kujensis]|uniref:chemotaxis protein CheB n=1 Tax=Pseudonocardia kujensis TaxID=1128675 RepID=UPI001E5AC19B|nr:chemotaxis protein CheB [Pseudonocardia kujensis]MCE0766948.1 response regulator [Pseudonocardia kujensis]